LAASKGCHRLRLAPRLPTASSPTILRLCAARYSTTPAKTETGGKGKGRDAFHTQLESFSFSAATTLPKTSTQTPQTLTEKIVQKYSVGLAPGKTVKSGDYVTLGNKLMCMTHDNTAPVATKFMSIGASKIHDNRQIVFCLDHDVQNKSEANLKKYKLIEEFAGKHGVDFYPAGRGIGHQIMVEEGYAWPGTMAVASDSHSNMYGGVGCLGTPVVRTDAASIWATGQTWQVHLDPGFPFTLTSLTSVSGGRFPQSPRLPSPVSCHRA